MKKPLGFRARKHMTRWIDPGELAKVGWRTLRSKHADAARDQFPPRARPTGEYVDGGDVWFDYVADLGDAFDPTMAVAWHLGRRRLFLTPDDPPVSREQPALPPDGLPRGRFVVLGGDEVYPYASRRRYDNQTVGPYSLAFEGGGEAELYALPGNHDWYGKLKPFSDTFCKGGRVGRWRCPQDATWFAVRLPKGWWLWALDTGLKGDINPAQRAYFTEMADLLTPGDRIVLCTPVPAWSLYSRNRRAYDVFDKFVTDVVGTRASVPLLLSGDSHMFAAFRRRGTPDIHVTTGGGGAFTHPTHQLGAVPRSPDEPEFKLLETYPEPDRSRDLGRAAWTTTFDWGSLLLLAGIALARAFYQGLTSMSVLRIGRFASLGRVVESVLSVLSAPVSWPVLIVVCFLGVVAVRPNTVAREVTREARRWGIVLGSTLVALFVLSAAARFYITDRWEESGVAQIVAVLGTTLGGAVLCLLTVTLLLAKINREIAAGDNLVFSALHLRLYKHFVRIRIDGTTGDLDLFAIGLDDPGRGWDKAMALDRNTPPRCTKPRYIWGTTIPSGPP